MKKQTSLTSLYFILVLYVVILSSSSCHFLSPTEPPLFQQIPADQSGIDFSNLLFEDTRLNIITFEYFYNGAGVAIGDINNDDLPDIFFTANMQNSRLYLNQGNFTFKDITISAGINTQGKWATGVSLVDINTDGWLDIYVSVAGPYPGEDRANMCYLNNGDLTFKDIAPEIGLADTGHTTHTAFFDYDRDGDLDAYLLTNTIDGLGPNIIRPKKLNGQSQNTDRLYNNEEGQFTHVSREAGILKEGYGLGISICDLNNDQWPDIYISNDYLSEDILYINQQNGTFVDKAAQYFQHTSYSAMGNDIADINQDGWPDIVAMDMLPPDHRRQKLMFASTNFDRYQSERRAGYLSQLSRNTFQLHQGILPNGELLFSEIGQLAGIQQTDWSWSVLIADYDLDGKVDMSITNGYPKDITNRDFAKYKMQEYRKLNGREGWEKGLIKAISEIEGAYLPNFLYQQTGSLAFKDVSSQWGFTKPSYSHGAAFGDLDVDGDLDLVINNTSDPAFIYRNMAIEQGKGHYLTITLEGSTQNPLGIGAALTITADSAHWHKFFTPYRGFQSTVEPKVHFGLGKVEIIDSLIVTWPDGRQHLLTQIPTNQTLHIRYEEAKEKSSIYAFNPVSSPSTLSPSHLFTDITDSLTLEVVHQDPSYADIKLSPLLPRSFSFQGPYISVGDVNNDQREDLFMGGSFKDPGTFLFQQADGTFSPQPLEASDPMTEELDHALFDADNDGDLDLYVCSGSSEFDPESPYLQDKLYINNGKGFFTYAPNALPEMLTSTSTVAAEDIDNDGDMDLFVGGRIITGAYPLSPRSYVLVNDGGVFKDVTDQWAKDLKEIGMVTDAIWTEVNADGLPDLILVGEWMPITICMNTGAELTLSNDPLFSKTVGWWNTISEADLDQDGDLDYILGNLGLNSPYRASEDRPVCVYAADFDQSGTIDPIICRFIGNQSYPVGFRDDMVNQMLTFRKLYPKYEDYAEVEPGRLFPDLPLEDAKVWKANMFQSCVLENNGKGKWSIHPLPVEAQFAPIQSILPYDVNKDGKEDLLISANFYEADVWTGPYDASSGLVLLNQGEINFQVLSAAQSGFYIPGDNRQLAMVRNIQGHPLIISSRNRGRLKVFSQKGDVNGSSFTSTKRKLPVNDILSLSA